MITIETFVHILDLGVVFAISGAVAAVNRRLDIFGIVVLSFVAGNFGGIGRDLLIGAVPEENSLTLPTVDEPKDQFGVNVERTLSQRQPGRPKAPGSVLSSAPNLLEFEKRLERYVRLIVSDTDMAWTQTLWKRRRNRFPRPKSLESARDRDSRWALPSCDKQQIEVAHFYELHVPGRQLERPRKVVARLECSLKPVDGEP
jgi:hypothetical protein